MLKSLLAGGLALAVAGSSLVYAQQRPSEPGARPAQQREHARPRPTAEDFSAMVDARIAGLKAGLRLTPDQEKNWPAVETAMRDLAKQRADRMKQRADRKEERAERRDLIERLRTRAETMSQRAADLKRLADASEPLYRTLDDGQKRRLGMLTRGFESRGHGHWRRH
ncbi:MAG: Spy/CpxP family protein refolding chaperone [Pseudorhodoplanes sp.]